ncbi:MAG: SRPBCC family protein [Nocardioides sp.]
MTVSDSIVIDADPMELYRQLADPSQMGRWSPENTGADAPAGQPLAVGATFVGTNKRGRARWSTRCVVTQAEPGRRFAFDVCEIGLRKPILRGAIATWDYTFVTEGGGTRITETWTDGRKGWPDPVAAVFDKVATGGKLFSDFQRRNIARTLANLKTDIEGAA